MSKTVKLPNGSTATPLSVVFANKNDCSLVIVEGDKWSTSSHPSSTFEPIGIVVIPGEHGVLKDSEGNKQCGIISLVPMNTIIPEKGGTKDDLIYFGGYGENNKELLKYLHSSKTSSSETNIADGYSRGSSAYIPRQNAVGGIPERKSSPYAPSPYIGSDYKSGGYNESYGLKNGVIDTENDNVLSDFNGIINTKVFTDLATRENWKKKSKITNDRNHCDDGYYPAACCCAKFKTNGTKAFVDCNEKELKNGKGFWYLPAAGELGYIIPRLYDINDTISKLKTAYGVGVSLNTHSVYWSSSVYSIHSAYTLCFSNGMINSELKDFDWNVRAFLRL